MTANANAKIGKVLAVAAAAYGIELGAERLKVYASLLEDLGVEPVAKAVRSHLLTCKWFPTIAEIRAEVVREQQADVLPAELAWGQVVELVRNARFGERPTWPTPEIAEAAQAVGVTHLLEMGVHTRVSNRARFIDAYRVVVERRTRLRQLGAEPAPPQLAERTGRPVKLSEIDMPALAGESEGS